ncbi:hypothetical protein NC651_000845 [Populus alba x Populus x berolinensis]|nr:hypothetical protein NC651_000845 [Populus alba x Populus x berolinensis]
MEGSCGLVQYEEYTACPGAPTRRMVVIPLRAPSATSCLEYPFHPKRQKWFQIGCIGMCKPAILTNKITAVLSAIAIHLNTEISLVLVGAIVAAITKTRTEIVSRRLQPSARFEWMRKELEGLSRRLMKIQRTLLRLQEQSRTRQWQLQHVCRPLVRWVQKIPAPMTTKSKPVKVPPSKAAFHLSLTLFLKLRSAISLASSEQLMRLSLNWKHVCDNAEW